MHYWGRTLLWLGLVLDNILHFDILKSLIFTIHQNAILNTAPFGSFSFFFFLKFVREKHFQFNLEYLQGDIKCTCKKCFRLCTLIFKMLLSFFFLKNVNIHFLCMAMSHSCWLSCISILWQVLIFYIFDVFRALVMFILVVFISPPRSCFTFFC